MNLLGMILELFMFLKLYLLAGKNKKYCIVDIDNTIANTWPQLMKVRYIKDIDFVNLSFFPDVIDMVINISRDECKVIFLSARPKVVFNKTRKWLNSIFENKVEFDLFLVKSPNAKLKYLKYLVKKGEIVYIDDLSYNTENGKTLYYEQIIEIIRKLPIKYIGHDELMALQNKISQCKISPK